MPDRAYRCIGEGCDAEPFSSLKAWKDHMKEEHGVSGDAALETLLPDGASRRQRESFDEKTVGVRLRLKDVLALEDEAERRGVNDGTCLRQIFLEHVGRGQEKAETAERLSADTDALAQRLAAFSKTGEPKAKGSENRRDEAQRLSNSLAKFAKRFKGEKVGGFWD